MLQIRKDLVALILGSAGVTNIIDDRVYAGLCPGGAEERPYVTFIMPDVEPLKHHAQNRAVQPLADRYTFLVIVWSENADQVAELAEAVIIAVDGQTGTDSDRFQWDGAAELADYKADNSGKVIHQVALNFITRRLPQ